MGIKETLEVINASIEVLKDATEAKEDGKISALEMIKIGISNASVVMAAVNGSDQIVLEVKDLDKAELEVLAGKAVELSKALMGFFGKVAA